MIGKKHIQGTKTVFAACDKIILNKIIEEKNISIKVKESFYGNKEITEKKLIQEIKKANSVNLIGEKVILTALKNNLISENAVKRIKGIPHIQIYRL